MPSLLVSVRVELVAKWEDEDGAGVIYAAFVGETMLGMQAVYQRFDETGDD